MALSTLSESQGHTGQATAIQPGQPRGLTVRERFDALTARQKDEIFDKYRDWNVEHVEWWDGVYDCFKRAMEAIGIQVDDIYFSGFSSQGDGACFEGQVSDWAAFLNSIKLTCTALTELAINHWSFSVKHSSHYYHEHCTTFSEDMVTPDYEDDDDDDDDDDWFIANYSPYDTDIQSAAWVALLCEHSFGSLLDDFMEAFKGHMRDLYSRLEAEHDHLTSDEAILESLECNDMLTEIVDELEEELEEKHA